MEQGKPETSGGLFNGFIMGDIMVIVMAQLMGFCCCRSDQILDWFGMDAQAAQEMERQRVGIGNA